MGEGFPCWVQVRELGDTMTVITISCVAEAIVVETDLLATIDKNIPTSDDQGVNKEKADQALYQDDCVSQASKA